MSDAELLAPDAGLPPVQLLANSYSLPDLMKASEHAAELKTVRGREENLANMPAKLALNQDVVIGLTQPALPTDHALRNIEDASGNIVRAAVPTIAGGFTDEEPARPEHAGISAGGARDEDLPERPDPAAEMDEARAAIAESEAAGGAEPTADEPPADPAPSDPPKPRRKRSTPASSD